MRIIRLFVVGLVLVAVSCGGGDSVDVNGGDLDNGGGEGGGVLSTDFSVSDLPADFPDDLVVPDIIGGERVEIGGLESVTFETSMSYEDAVAFYTDALGDPTFVGGDADSRLGSWTNHGDWAVQVLGTNPVAVGVVRVPAEE